MTLSPIIPAASCGLTPEESAVLTLLSVSDAPERQPAALAARCSLSPDAVTKVLASLTKRGVIDDGLLMPAPWKPRKGKAAVVVPVANPDHALLMDRWCKDYEQVHGYKYDVNGPRDGKAVKLLLLTKRTIDDLMGVATNAWQRSTMPGNWFRCKQAATLHGFQENLMPIQSELRTPPQQNGYRTVPPQQPMPMRAPQETVPRRTL